MAVIEDWGNNITGASALNTNNITFDYSKSGIATLNGSYGGQAIPFTQQLTSWPNTGITLSYDSTGQAILKPVEDKKVTQPHKTLFNVIVVDLDAHIIMDEKIVATDEAEAKFELKVDAKLRENKLKPKDVTIICHPLGSVAVRKEPETVRMIQG